MSLMKRDPKIVEELSKLFGMVCNYCGTSLTGRFTIDHIVPLTSGGTHEVENLMLCCTSCNVKKGRLSLEEFRRKDWFQREIGITLIGNLESSNVHLSTTAVQKIETYTGRKFDYSDHKFFFEKEV